METNQVLPAELYRAAQVRELDRLAIEERGIPGYTLMSRAGQACFSALREIWPEAERVVVVCGAGNNAGDGYVVARLAKQAGLESHALWLRDPRELRGDAWRAAQDAAAAEVPIQPFQTAPLLDAEVVVDALLGTGLEREVSGRWREAVERINGHHAGVLAVDIPSGLHADRGAVLGAAVRADVTVSFIGLKQGLFTGQGPACCGRVIFDALGAPADLYAEQRPAALRYVGQDLPRLLPRRSRSAHKGSHGHVLVVGGDHGMAGAARMAAESAARVGSGLVSVATRSDHASVQAALRPELMFRGVEDGDSLDPLLERATVVVVGPGLGQTAWGRVLLETVLDAARPLVVDADGLNLLVGHPRRRDDWVLTPHPGEAARLLGSDSATVEADRFAAVTELADRFGGVAVLKGAGTLVAAADEPVTVCVSGNPGMGSGGMGDVLTGVIAGLLAQGLSPLEAARAGVYLHGRAGDLAAEEGGERGLMALDLLPQLRRLVNP